MPTLQIMPSLLAADIGRLREECIRAVEAGADGIHLDIMDGHFVGNLSFGTNVVAMARDCVNTHLSVHLMLTQPHLHAEAFLEAGADTLLFHVEAESEIRPLLKVIERGGKRPGLTLNPETPAAAVLEYLPDLSEVLCMTVHPGFGGQQFLETALPTMRRLRAAAPKLDISVDGGVDDRTAPLAAEAGANILIAGTYLFRAADMKAEIQRMRSESEKRRKANDVPPVR